jgi:hypothetical protein
MEKKKSTGSKIAKGSVNILLYVLVMLFFVMMIAALIIAYISDKPGSDNLVVAQIGFAISVFGIVGINLLRMKLGMKMMFAKKGIESKYGLFAGQILGFVGLFLWVSRWYLAGTVVIAISMSIFAFINFKVADVIRNLPNTDPELVRKRFYKSGGAAVGVTLIVMWYQWNGGLDVTGVVMASLMGVLGGFFQLGWMTLARPMQKIESHLYEMVDSAKESDAAWAQQLGSDAPIAAMSTKDADVPKLFLGLYYLVKFIASPMIGFIVLYPYIKALSRKDQSSQHVGQ